MFFRAIGHEYLFCRKGCTHMFKNKRSTYTIFEGSFLGPLDGSFLGPWNSKSMTLPGKELKNLPLAIANQTVFVSSDSQNGTTVDETKNILKAFKFQGVLCTATTSVVSCQIKNSCHIILEILASCARVKCSVNLTFFY